MDVYDSLEICQMQVGDTLKYSDREIIFNDMKHEDEYLKSTMDCMKVGLG